ncbi:hypothetical protein [Salirhabdus sp. Marseille-P4669]|nr:hypothetical protein [Salirhabdus sp. Marseille-P4669]
MDKKENKELEQNNEEEFITQQIQESYQSGLIEPRQDEGQYRNKK